MGAPEDEIILDESTSEAARTVRVYDRGGDFLIDVPAGAKITFGYFNPAAPSERNAGYDNRGNVARQTALRIYERGEKGNQLACFLGVTGFRDHSIKLTRLTQRVTIETNFEDDGRGREDFARKAQRMLEPVVEDEDITF